MGFLLWSCVPEPYTLYRNFFSVPAGHSLWVDRCGPKASHRYFDIAAELEQAASTRVERPAAEVLKDALRDSVRHHLIADVPVGSFLSTGLDSSTPTALATEACGQAPLPAMGFDFESRRIQAITLSFAEYRNTSNDEVPLARKTAKYYGCTHHVGHIFEASLPAILNAMDQPSIDGVNTWFVAREAKRAGVKVAISELGGDDLLGGGVAFSLRARPAAQHFAEVCRSSRVRRDLRRCLPTSARPVHVLGAPAPAGRRFGPRRLVHPATHPALGRVDQAHQIALRQGRGDGAGQLHA